MGIEICQRLVLLHIIIGIDIGAAAGTELVAIMDGTVTSVGWAGGGRIHDTNILKRI